MIQRLQAKAVEKPEWGSTQLEPWFPNADRKIGEMWFEGPGDAPLLIKFLFTTAALSVQVHPDDAYAAAHHATAGAGLQGKMPRGKTEMWHILHAEPGAKIAAGFRETVTAQQVREAAMSGEIEQLLAWHDARPGDTFFIPAGTVHAIGAGLALCEIQQTSDITYRLYDYGRARELHLEHGVAVSDLGPYPGRQASSEGVLVDCPFFKTEKYIVTDACILEALGRDQTIVVLEGQGTISGRDQDGQIARAGDVFYATADAGAVTLRGSLTVLRTYA